MSYEVITYSGSAYGHGGYGIADASRYEGGGKECQKPPEWLGGAPDGYLIVTVEAPTLSEAQRRATAEITERIITP